MISHSIRVWGLEGIPEITPGDDLCRIIFVALSDERSEGIAPGAILVVAQKVISKAEGRIVHLDDVRPSPQAQEWATQHQKDARYIEVVLREAKHIVRMDRGILIAETRHGFICANAGVDASNAPKGTVILLPEDPDRSARSLQAGLQEALGVPLGIIISDTFGRPWRRGLTNIALGIAGLSPFIDYRGRTDSSGRTLQATVLAVADEISGAAELVMGKTSRIPVALVEGFRYIPGVGSGREIIRPHDENLFR